MPPFSGGVHSHSNGGYLRISAGPLRDKLVHVLIAEAYLRRPLREDEDVHHKDGNTKNPSWGNLVILGKEVHNAVSNRQRYYLKQKYSAERAAWWAYFDVTGETYLEYDARISKDLTSFDPAEFEQQLKSPQG